MKPFAFISVSLLVFTGCIAHRPVRSDTYFLPCAPNASVSFKSETQAGRGLHRLEVRRLAYALPGADGVRHTTGSCVIYYAGDEYGPSVLRQIDDCIEPLVRKVSEDLVEIYYTAGAHTHIRERWRLLGYKAKLEGIEGISWRDDPRMSQEALPAAATGPKPNILLIYADDLGYGDVSCYGAKPGLTPNVDRLAREGLRFTDGHCTSATCTPSRYALLTGEYPWRKRGTGVLPGDAALVIEPARGTMPLVLQKAGYATGAVGKWHLGLGPQGGPDWNGLIEPGAREVGFAYSFLMPATGDRVPCVYVENGRVVGLEPGDAIIVSYKQPFPGLPTGTNNPEMLTMHPSHGHDQAVVNGISRIGHMSGGKTALWKDEEMADVFTKKAVAFIKQHRHEPFFLYFGPHDIHVPRVPHPRFVGKSGMGPRGDAIVQMDWCIGELLATLDRLKLAERTLVLFTSDNGPVVDDGYKDEAAARLGSHRPAGPLRGGKYSIFEGGTRVPFIVRWPGRVKPGVSDALVSQIDFLASFAVLAGAPLSPAETKDSQNHLPALLGETKTGRETLVVHSGAIALRAGPWKYIEPRAGARTNATANPELGNDSKAQLYNLAENLGERRNLAAELPDKVKELAAQLQKIRAAGRLPGPALKD